MLVVAMAFGWCVISAGVSEKDRAARGEAPTTESAQPPSLGPDVKDAKAAIAPAVPIEGERTPIRTAIPADVIALARTFVNMPMGTEQVEEIGGQRYVFVLERHYHPPGFVGAPSGWHKGVTAYELH